MLSIAGSATSKLQEMLTSSTGLNASLAALAQSENMTLLPVLSTNVFTDNVSSDITEKSVEPKYPAIYIYCDKMTNALTEKFRRFSGTIEMIIDVRVSQDRLDGIDQMSQLYTAGVTQTLGQNRGDWGDGLFYAGRYEISFGPVKHGGRNFIKSAKLAVQLNASID